MAKQTVVTGKVEIIKQVRLTTNQRLQLVKMSNEGGAASNGLDWGVKTDLIALGLIEERPKHTAESRRSVGREIAELGKQAKAALSAKDARRLDGIASDINYKQSDLERKAFWLTDAANEYLTKGKVTVVR